MSKFTCPKSGLKFGIEGITLVFVMALSAGGCRPAPSPSKAPSQPVKSSLIYTAAGNGSTDPFRPGLAPQQTPIHAPAGLALDSEGNLYISQTNAVRKLTVGGKLVSVAGSEKAGFGGDGGPAVNALLRTPTWLTVDSAGNLFIADHGNHCVRKVNRQGMISTVVGIPPSPGEQNPKGGFSGDGGPATAARLNAPDGLAMDSSGALYLSDMGNHRVRKVNSKGIITTIAGNGYHDSLGRGGFSGDGGPATAARLYYPAGLALDLKGNLYFADEKNGRIRKITPQGIITTVAGTGRFGFNGDGQPATHAVLNDPVAVAVDRLGILYFVDRYNHVVRRVSPSGKIETITGKITPLGTKCCQDTFKAVEGGPALDADLFFPSDLALDQEGNLYIADMRNNRVRKVTKVAAPGLLAGRIFPAR